MASFGTPLSSIPNTSYLNVSSPVSYTGSTGGTGMDPGTALAISAGSSALTGGISAAGSKKGGNRALDAAQAQSDAIKQASENMPLITLGTEIAAKQFDQSLGGPMDRAKEFDDAKFMGAMAFSPGQLAQQRLQLSQELAGIRSQAYGKEMDPFRRFV